MTDPIADMLTRIRNAQQAKQARVLIPVSKMKLGIAEILKQEGYIADFRTMKQETSDVIELKLKYDQHNAPVILGIKRISKPGRRTYIGYQEIPTIQNGLGIAILTTSKGVLADREARKQQVGGEVLCYVW